MLRKELSKTSDNIHLTLWGKIAGIDLYSNKFPNLI